MERMHALKRGLAVGSAVTLWLGTGLFSGNAAGAELTLTASAKTLRVTGSLWTPYLDSELPNGGLAVDLVRTALTRAGYAIEPSVESWSRAYEGTAVGVYDVVAAVWQNEERSEDLLFSEPYLLNDIVLLARKGILIEFANLSDLAGYRIGVVREYAYEDAFDRDPNLNRVTSNHLIQNLLLLRQGKLEMIVGDKWSIFYQISRYMPDDLEGFKLLPQPLTRRALRLGVSRHHAEAALIIDRFDQAIAAMKQDRTYTDILRKHTEGLVVLPGKR